jgi:hypothetical protein
MGKIHAHGVEGGAERERERDDTHMGGREEGMKGEAERAREREIAQEGRATFHTHACMRVYISCVHYSHQQEGVSFTYADVC